MLLKNYDLIALTRRFSVSSNLGIPHNGSNSHYCFPGKDECFKTYNKTNNVLRDSTENSTLCVGSNDTPVTYDDYRINLISGLTCISVTQSAVTIEDNLYKDSVSVIFCNSNTSPVTIKELGIYYSGQTNKQAAPCNFLVYREVLDTPVEVPVGANVVITFSKSSTIYNNAPADYASSVSVE